MRIESLGAFSVFALLALWAPSAAQVGNPEVESAIRALITAEPADTVDPCSFERRQRVLSARVISLGKIVIPRVEAEIDRLQHSGEPEWYSEKLLWLLNVYAELNGKNALGRIRLCYQESGDALAQKRLDGLTAVALRVTSVVSSRRTGSRTIHCTRASGPKDALDRLLIGWLTGDTAVVRSALGSEGTMALQGVLGDDRMQGMRRQLLGAAASMRLAIAFDFEGEGAWGEPDYLILRSP